MLVIWQAFWASWMFLDGEKPTPTGKPVRWGSFWVTFCDYVGPMLGRFGSTLGPCWVIWWALWASMEVSRGKKKPPTKKLSVEGYFGWLFATMSGQCWAVLGLCWAHVGSSDGLYGLPWRFLDPQQESLSVEVHFGWLFDYVGPMLGRFGSMLGPCWVIWWALWASMEVSRGKKSLQQKSCPLRVILGDFLRLCRANVWAVLGLCWAHVGSSDGLYGLPWRFLDEKNQPQRESLSVEVHFGWLFGTMSGQCWAVLGLCWAHVGSFGGLSVASRNCYMEAC